MKKVLIANRGEIAVRIIRACKEMGLSTVAVYSQVDSEALHVLHADEAICIGKDVATGSYLKIPHILSACEITGADALHPGYGFLSENAKFAAICEGSGLTFIGPSSQAIALLGNKARAKEIAQSVGCPVIPGSDGIVATLDEALKIARTIGFPLMIKASAGGGGRGIRVADNEEDFVAKFEAARSEAEIAFNCPDLYLEKLIINPRHIEIQILADKYGHAIHLGERDCTIQRRRQKLIEETPSPVLTDAMRKKIGAAAVAIVHAASYSTVGTVEFLLDAEGNFYFMEVNTRIQVEHTITEEVTGIDLVKAQIRMAMGETLTLKQQDVAMEGTVLEFRINAEDPATNFTPCPGKLEYYIPPGGPNVRVDSACYSGCIIPPNYDSMIAKLIVKGKDRHEAIAIAKRALAEFHVGYVKTTIPFHTYMLHDETFLSGHYAISYVDTLIVEGCTFQQTPNPAEAQLTEKT